MGKVLLTKKNYQEHLCIENQVAYIENNMILTPGVKDVLRNKGIAIKYGQKPICDVKAETTCPIEADLEIKNETSNMSSEAKSCGENLTTDQIAAIVSQVLQAEFGKADAQMAEAVLRRILSAVTF